MNHNPYLLYNFSQNQCHLSILVESLNCFDKFQFFYYQTYVYCRGVFDFQCYTLICSYGWAQKCYLLELEAVNFVWQSFDFRHLNQYFLLVEKAQGLIGMIEFVCLFLVQSWLIVGSWNMNFIKWRNFLFWFCLCCFLKVFCCLCCDWNWNKCPAV